MTDRTKVPTKNQFANDERWCKLKPSPCHLAFIPRVDSKRPFVHTCTQCQLAWKRLNEKETKK